MNKPITVQEDPSTFIHILPNGRVYKLRQTGKPYQGLEYPEGGIHITAWEPRAGEAGEWVHVDHSPDQGCADEFLKGVSRLPPIPEANPSSTVGPGFYLARQKGTNEEVMAAVVNSNGVPVVKAWIHKDGCVRGLLRGEKLEECFSSWKLVHATT